jgi:hypothetical protein
MTYGRDVDWARNIVKAHGCQMEQMGRRFTTSNPRVVDFDAAEPELPGAVREAFRIADLPDLNSFANLDGLTDPSELPMPSTSWR